MTNENAKSEYLLEVKDLKQYFPVRTGFMKTLPLKAVDGVSFSIKPGETLGLVGESGCGKTTVGRSILRLYTPTGGEVIFDGKPVDEKSIHEMRKQMQMVFQDPYSSLNPRMTVEDIIGEPLDVHKLYQTKEERRARVLELMTLVGLNAEHATRYAHEFSGGQRQRIGIARALATNPRFIVCDEAVSALDKLDGGLALSDSAVAEQQHSLAVHLDEHAVPRYPLRKADPEEGYQARHEFGCPLLGAQERNGVFLRRLEKFGEHLETRGDDNGDRLLRHEAHDVAALFFMVERGEVCVLAAPDELDALRVEMTEKAGESKSRAV